jgi:hypothetical protein
MQDNHVERCHRTFIINAPCAFTLVWKVRMCDNHATDRYQYSACNKNQTTAILQLRAQTTVAKC